MVTSKYKSKRKLIILPFAIIGILLLGIIIFIQSPLFRVQLSQSEMHLELGESADNSPYTYLDGANWCVPLSYVDTSAVKENQIGRYPIHIYHGFQQYICYVNVTDTIAPEVHCDIQSKTILPGEIISVNNLGLKINDYSDIASIAFTRITSTHFYTGLPDEKTEEMRAAYQKGFDIYAEEFQFAYGGIYTLTITVKDEFHNSSNLSLTLKVEQPPFIETPNDYYISIAESIPFEEYITAYDFLDGELDNSTITIDTSELKTEKAGNYPVYFTATDSYGLSTTVATTVHVDQATNLQTLINTHQIHFDSDVIIGAYNPYDSGYYEEDNIDFIQNVMQPAIVNIQNDIQNLFGGGFIIAIDNSFVTIATNEHVVTKDMMPTVTFHNGNSYTGAVVATNPQDDIAFIRIPIEKESSQTSLSFEDVKHLRTVHINESYWNSLDNSKKLSIGYRCIDAKGDIWTSDSGHMIEKAVSRNWNEDTNITEMLISMKPVAGSSGSAIFDGHGYLIGMIRGYTDYNSYTEYVAVPLNRILKYYELIFKTKVQYQ